uniref:Uncharacterized protein n=1 Tax=Ditylenchus dipsaci TaxID=166011 RepID=A0A915CYE1_9BILA
MQTLIKISSSFDDTNHIHCCCYCCSSTSNGQQQSGRRRRQQQPLLQQYYLFQEEQKGHNQLYSRSPLLMTQAMGETGRLSTPATQQSPDKCSTLKLIIVDHPLGLPCLPPPNLLYAGSTLLSLLLELWLSSSSNAQLVGVNELVKRQAFPGRFE